MEQLTQFNANETHALAKFENRNGVYYTLREINQKGYNVFKTALGREVLRIPDIESNDPDGYWAIVGYYSKQDGDIIKKGLIEKDIREGRNVLRNYKVDEQVVRLAA